MELQHIAITVTDVSEIERFYGNILGMQVIRNFVLNKSLSGEIFDIEEDTEVFLLQKDNLQFEIFLKPYKHDHNFNHICFSTATREDIIEKAIRYSYKCLRFKRKNSEMIFISDNSGNVFEIKQSDQ